MTMALIVLIVAILLGALGQIALKTGINQLGVKPAPLVVLASIFTKWQVTAGFVCYALSSLLYMVALSRLDLSYAYPMVAISYVMVTFLSWRFLGEPVPLMRAVSLGVICVGVLGVAFSYKCQSPTPQNCPTPPALHGPADAGRQ